jgi:hypothetical protein
VLSHCFKYYVNLSFIQIQPIKAVCIQSGTCLHLVDREENSVSKFFDFDSCVLTNVVANSTAHSMNIQVHET